MLGLDPAGVTAQVALERRFDRMLKAGNLEDWMKRMSSRPHHVGSPHGKDNVDFMAGLFRSWGYDTKIETFEILFPTPRVRELRLIEPVPFIASLNEPPLAEDSTSNQQEAQLPPYNAYSIDGNVEGELVYVHYGRPEDYEVLERHGVDVAGRIVLARYGGSWRGIKPKVAAEKGAVGCVLYSDPRDDGYFQGQVYPEGAFKNDRGVQRGSVADMPLFPGDPLTPGVAASGDVQRLPREQAPTLTRIPVLPISYADASPLLHNIAGPVAPEEWRGALPLTYRLGPGPARVRLRVEFDWKLVPAYDIIATLAGNERPDQWIMRGNHHDAWVHGATDPVSGLVAMLEEARVVGQLVRDGWKPKRTIVYAAWDAEEPGLIGSTEWVEKHAATLSEKLAVYINSDSNGRGFLYAGGSHTLERFANQVARDVMDPQKGISVADRARARLRVHGTEDQQREARERDDLRLYALGSGSDYTPFLQHLGIASLNVGFGGENAGGEYHSIYDSFDHFTRFGDPGFDYGIALAQVAGRLVLRLAGAEILPFEFGNFVDTVGDYVEEVTGLADEMREATERNNRLIDEKLYQAVSDPRMTFVAPPQEEPVPHLNFAPLHNVMERLRAGATAYRDAFDGATAEWASLQSEVRAELDRILYRTERSLTREDGLPGRPWFRHQIYAPGFYTGYGVKTLPGIREAIEQRQWEAVEEQICRATETLEAFAARLDEAARLLRPEHGRPAGENP